MDLPHPLCASSHSLIKCIIDTGIAVGFDDGILAIGSLAGSALTFRYL